MKILSMVVEYEIYLNGVPRHAHYDGQTGVLTVLDVSETDARSLLVKAEDATIPAPCPPHTAVPQFIPQLQEVAKPVAKAKKPTAPPKTSAAPPAPEPAPPVKLVIIGDSVAAVALEANTAPEANMHSAKPADPGPAVVHNLQPRELTEGERLEMEGKPTPERIAFMRAILPADISQIKKMKDIVVPLLEAGISNAEEVYAFCETLRSENESLRVMGDMRGRVMQSLSTFA